MQFLKILLLSIVAAVVYGILHDLVTAHVCVEYFTIGHPPVFRTHSPTLLAFGWGTIASWWMGAFLGILLALAAQLGPYTTLNAFRLIRPIGVLLVVMAVFAALSGIVGYLGARNNLVPALDYGGIFAPEKAWRFTADYWAHSASYFVGFWGGLTLCFWTLLYRKRISQNK